MQAQPDCGLPTRCQQDQHLRLMFTTPVDDGLLLAIFHLTQTVYGSCNVEFLNIIFLTFPFWPVETYCDGPVKTGKGSPRTADGRKFVIFIHIFKL